MFLFKSIREGVLRERQSMLLFGMFVHQATTAVITSDSQALWMSPTKRIIRDPSGTVETARLHRHGE